MYFSTMANGIRISLPKSVQNQVLKNQTRETDRPAGEMFGFSWQVSGVGDNQVYRYDIAFTKEKIAQILNKLGSFLRHIYDAEVQCAQDSLINVGLNIGDCSLLLDITIEGELFEWASYNLLELPDGSKLVLSSDIETASARIWQALMPSTAGQKPEKEDFICCSTSKRGITFGRARGSQSFTMLTQGPNAFMRISDCSIPLAALIVYQLAMVEEAYHKRPDN